MKTLPQELVDAIIQCISDPLSLTSCALVCPNWTFSSQAQLLQNGVRFDLRNFTIDTVESLRISLRLHPHLRRHLHDVEIRNAVRRIPPEWGNCLADILDRSQKLRRLSLKTVRWSFLPSKLQQTISNSLQLPSFRCLELRSFVAPDCNALTSLLSLPKHLESLQLRSVTWSDFAENITDVQKQVTEPQYLESLTVITASMNGILSWLLAEQSSLRLSCLRRLQLSNACNPSSLTQLLELTSPTLEHLILEPIYTFHQPIVGPHLSNLPRLLHLELAGTYRFLLPLIENAFTAIENPHPLKTVKIQVEESSCTEDWRSVDTLLSQNALKSLDSVEFRISTRCMRQGEVGLKSFLDQFPALHAKRLCSLAVYGRPGSAAAAGGIKACGS